ncbi:microcin C ABC transporter permease YejB [Marinobacter daepoensis]|uniref:Microcin C ABC transporter permease YejB n=1 Tax=Marinobacter daepoensis TaxID=262077 RepID=A0ABS3BAS4_9GAMM|nr:microcin C ABC transporter permease YejB [Marinobacter daepoensis]MBN7768969.1 microcin C ABC transporter permease YejB [Marinobacter daepoensis]MBY6032426.1 microcin C ABC transporter permease YejB [Marinobacter daepoensis]MBY6077659.1 microcin C ABC transporter permease YejB [Marinobacter daepoensis]
MGIYILRRIALIIPTLLGIMLLNFVIVQAAPGGPIEQVLAEMEGHGSSALARAGGGDTGGEVSTNTGDTRASRGLPPELLEELETLYGFDRPAHERFLKMLGDYATFDFGDSFFRDRSVVELIIDKMPVSISLGLWSTLIIYLVSIPLGVRKAVTDGSRFDVWTSSAIVIGYAIPGFLFAILLIVLFAGGSYFDWFPLRGLTSPGFDQMTWYQKIADYFWHLALPVTANVIGGFATLTLLTKNSFLDEISKQYVVTARAKGLEEKQVLYGHVFRNAMLIVIASMPGVLVSLFFTGSLLIEVIFSLDGLGLLGFEAALNRDYPVIFGTLYILTLMGLILKLISDLTYVAVDPRIDFESREGA